MASYKLSIRSIEMNMSHLLVSESKDAEKLTQPNPINQPNKHSSTMMKHVKGSPWVGFLMT